MPIPNFTSQDQRPGSALARVHLLLRNLMLIVLEDRKSTRLNSSH